MADKPTFTRTKNNLVVAPDPSKPMRGGYGGGSQKGVAKVPGSGIQLGYSRKPWEFAKNLLLEVIEEAQDNPKQSLRWYRDNYPKEFYDRFFLALVPKNFTGDVDVNHKFLQLSTNVPDDEEEVIDGDFEVQST